MNKKLVTLAVAAAMVAPAAAMADAVLYGKLNVGINYVDQDNGFEGWGLSDNRAVRPLVSPFITTPQGPANRIGVKGSEDLGNGLKAIYQIEFGVSLSDSNNYATNSGGSETLTMRNSFVGLAGGWGTFLMGRHDTPLKISTGPLDLFADTLADYNNTVGFQDIRADNAIAYISPSFSGFTFAAAVHAGGGATFGGDYNVESDSLAEAYSFAGIYKNGPWYASLAYEGLDSQLSYDRFSVNYVDIDGPGIYPVLTQTAAVEGSETWGKWRVGLGILNWNGFTLTGVYENWQDAFWSDGIDADLWNIQAGYTFGNFMVKAAYGDTNVGSSIFDDEDDSSDDYNWTTWSFGLDYNMSKRTKAFLLYTDNNADDLCDADECSTDWQGFQLGMMHTF
jgi:predicted porin